MNLKDIYIRDPFIVVKDDEFYLFGSNGTKNFLCYHSLDLVNFDEPKVVFNPDENFQYDKDFWAPEVHYLNNQYYLIASFKNDFLKRCSLILESKELMGPYKPLTAQGITPDDEEALDGTLVSLNDSYYLVYSHEWLECHDGEMKICKLSKDLKQRITKPEVLFKASSNKLVLGFGDNKENFITDGPEVYQMGNKEFIMLWSSLNYDNKYSEFIATSTSLFGPYKQQNKPLYTNDGGHGMIFNYHHKKYFVCHSPNTFDGKERIKIFEINYHNHSFELGLEVTNENFKDK